MKIKLSIVTRHFEHSCENFIELAGHICENKGADQLSSECMFVFATQKVQSLFCLKPKL